MKPDEVDKIARLARIDLSAAEREQFARQLTSILDYFEQLQTLDTQGVPATSHPPELVGPRRADAVQPSEDFERLLELSRGAEPPFLVVPRILF